MPAEVPNCASCGPTSSGGGVGGSSASASAIEHFSGKKNANATASPAAHGCPPRMADGRLFTDYRPRCDINLQYAAPMAGSWDYRQYLIHNGDKIIEANRAAAVSHAGCAPCVQPYDQGTMAPEADRVVCDKVSCARVRPPKASPFGIGTGRDYGTTEQVRSSENAFVLSQQHQQQQQMQIAAGYPGAAPSAPGPARWTAPSS